MSDSKRFELCPRTEATGSEDIVFGKAFAFFKANALIKSGYSWLTQALGLAAPRAPQVISLLGQGEVEIAGLKVTRTELSPLILISVTADKNIYRSEQDVVNLLILSPFKSDSEVVVNVECNGSEYSRHVLRLGAHGEGQLTLRNLPIGEFKAFLAEADDRACEFLVAEYRLVPLVASLQESRVEAGNILEAVLKLESFGVPVNGEVQIEMMERYTRIASVIGSAIDGILNVKLPMQGKDALSLQIQLKEDAAKTACVPIRGSRADERSYTVFSPLGEEISGSLLSEPGAEEVRGIFLNASGARTTPISLEKVNTNVARLRLNCDVQAMRIVVIDPSFPRARADALPVVNAPHPESYDEVYVQADKLLKQGRYGDACVAFERARSIVKNPHCYYAYSIACCLARQGRLDHALTALRWAIEDGWSDFDHMKDDDDLGSLRERQDFQSLCAGGCREVSFANLPVGDVIEIGATAPMTVLSIGAFIDDKPWEGWTTIVSPADNSLTVDLPARCKPAEEIVINLSTDPKRPAAVFCVLKDARLLSTDMPVTRLASGLKSYAANIATEFPIAFPTSTMKEIVNDLKSRSGWELAGSFGSAPMTGGWGSSLAMRGFSGAGAPPGGSGIFMAAGVDQDLEGGAWGQREIGNSGPAQPAVLSMAEKFGSSTKPAYSPAKLIDESLLDKAGVARVGTGGALTASDRNQDRPLALNDPEILFAGFVKLVNGKGSIKVQLPENFADYILECFAISGMDWLAKEVRFRACSPEYVHLTVPVFVRADEFVRGTLHVFSEERKVRVRLLRDGVEVALSRDNKPFGADDFVSAGSATLTFDATAGEYQAILLDEDGAIISRMARNVNEQGKLRRRLRTQRVLEAGQTLAFADSPETVALRVMPSIETPFNLLCDSTANYGHACCEQTAAIILSACSMYMFAGNDDERRKNAESIIIAGVKREQSMWLPGRGLKMYPEMPDSPNLYLSERAVRSLWYLNALTGGGGNSGGGPTPDLAAAVKQGLEIATDVTKALNMQWPPSSVSSCEDAYLTICSGDANKARAAVEYLSKYQPSKPTHAPPASRYFGQGVCSRMETAYAAAGLVRHGGAGNLKKALTFANEVISQFNEDGRLYSTADSAAAISLMAELKTADLIGMGSTVEVDGMRMTSLEAYEMAVSLSSIKVMEGCTMVAVDRVIEEDWDRFVGKIQVKVSLLKNGRSTFNFEAGDAIDLVVKLEQGYCDGDLLWICLPDAVSRVVGGGQVKLFAIDFRGQSELTVPLAATGTTYDKKGAASKQHLAVCIRNMFDEERAASPGLLMVSVK